MSLYADTNILVQFYLDLDGTGDTRKLLQSEKFRSDWPFPVVRLLRMEFRNALGRLLFESNHGGQWRVTPEIVAATQAIFDEHVEEQIFLESSAPTLADVEPVFTQLCERHTAKHGFRTYDMLHVSTALVLGSEWFFSFDKKANRLAELEGLRTI